MSAPRTGRVLVTGAAGMLGQELLRRVPSGTEAIATDLVARAGVHAGGVDLADREAVSELWREHGPFEGVIHAAAWTAVDAAEEQEALARRANVEASGVLAEACRASAAHLVVVGTDFVFDGESRRAYREDDVPRPLSAYGRTKLDGERAALQAHPRGTAVVRTQWLYGPGGKHFPRTIAQVAREKRRLKVVDDQVGAPTTTLELAPALWFVLARRATGIFHGACEGQCTWHGFTAAILEELGIRGQVELTPCTTAEFQRPARRPAFSVLDSSKLAELRGHPFQPWRTALRDYLSVEPL